MYTISNDIKEYFKLEEKIRRIHLKAGQDYKIKHPTGEFTVEIISVKNGTKNQVVTWRRDNALFGTCIARDFINMIIQEA